MTLTTVMVFNASQFLWYSNTSCMFFILHHIKDTNIKYSSILLYKVLSTTCRYECPKNTKMSYQFVQIK